MTWRFVILSFSSVIALVIVFIGVRWMIVPSIAAAWRTSSPPSFTSTGPTITALQAMGHLVTLKYSTGDVLEANDKSFRGAWIVKGDALIAVDLRKAKLISTDEQARTVVLQLPKPRSLSPRVDHEKTKTYSFQRSTWLFIPGWGDQAPLRDQAMKEAQHLVEFACSHEDVIEQARTNAALMIRTMYQMADYSVEIDWVDDQVAPNEGSR
jgi:hypothetical protein